MSNNTAYHNLRNRIDNEKDANFYLYLNQCTEDYTNIMILN